MVPRSSESPVRNVRNWMPDKLFSNPDWRIPLVASRISRVVSPQYTGMSRFSSDTHIEWSIWAWLKTTPAAACSCSPLYSPARFGVMPSCISPCSSRGERKGSEKNRALSVRLIPKSSRALEPWSSTRILLPPISPAPP